MGCALYGWCQVRFRMQTSCVNAATCVIDTPWQSWCSGYEACAFATPPGDGAGGAGSASTVTGARPARYFLAERGADACPEGTASVLESECEAANKALSPALRRPEGPLAVGRWAHVPTGCSTALDSAAHYNTDSPAANDGGYALICQAGVSKAFELWRVGLECSTSKALGGINGGAEWLRWAALRNSSDNDFWHKDYVDECARHAAADPECGQHFELHTTNGCRCLHKAARHCNPKEDPDVALYRFTGATNTGEIN